MDINPHSIRIDAPIYCFTVKTDYDCLDETKFLYKNDKTRRISSALCKPIEISNQDKARFSWQMGALFLSQKLH
jgi:hypothetical protein